MKVIDYINEHLDEIKDKYNNLIEEEKEEYENVINEIQEKNKQYNGREIIGSENDNRLNNKMIEPVKDERGFLKKYLIYQLSYIKDPHEYRVYIDKKENDYFGVSKCAYYNADKYNGIHSDMLATRSLLQMMLEIKDNTPKMDCISKYSLNKISKYRKIINYDKTWDWSASSSSSSEYQSSSSGSLKGGYGRSLFSASGYIKGNSQSQTQSYSSSSSDERGKDDIIIEYQYNLDYDMDLVLLEHPDIFDAIWEIYKGGK